MTNKELLEENAFLKQKIQELEYSESERKHADAALIESEERFQQLFDHMADGVAVYQEVDEGQDFVFVDINRTGQILSKIGLDESVGRRVTELFPAVERMGLLDVFRRVWRTGQPEHHPLTEYVDDRIVQWVENYVFKLPSGLIVVIFSDTSDKHRGEELLRRSEENFRNSLDHSPLGVRIVTEEGETIYANRAILDLFGYDSVEELRETPTKKRYTPESFAEFQIRREKRKQGNEVSPEYDIGIVRKDGEVRHLQVFRKEVLWGGKRQFQVLYNDITERKQAEEALRKSQEQLRNAHRLAHIGVWNWIAETDTVLWTEELYRIADLDPMLPAPTYTEQANIYAPESWDLLKEAVERAMKTGEPYQLALKLIRPDGTPRWVNAFGGLTYDSHGRIQGLHGTLQDITERKRAEEALRESEENYRNLFENAAEAIFVAQDGKIVFFNPMTAMMTGYSGEELMTRPFIEFIHTDDRNMVIDRHTRRIKGEELPHIYSFRIIHRDGNIRWVELNAVMINWKGKTATLNFVSNITERKKTEEALKKSVALHKEAQRVARIGHWELEADIGTPVWSEEIFRIFGLEPCEGEPSFTNHETHVHPEDWPILDKTVRKAASVGTPFDLVFRIMKTGGDIGWMHVIGTTTQDDKGHVTKLFGTAQDITALRQMEKALREKDLKLSHLADELELIMDSVPGLIFFKDTENRFIRANKFVADALQMTKEQVEGKSCFEIFPNKMAQAFFEDDLEVIRNRRPKLNIEEEWETAYGTRYVNTSKIPYLNDKGEVSGVIGMSLDITKRKNAEKSLRESESFARSTLDGLSAHIAIIDEFGVIVAVNRSWREFAEENPPVRGNVCEGANYLDICDGAPSEAPEAAKFAEAIRSILHGSAEKFEMEYACNSPEEQRWFVGRVTRFPDSTVPRVVVAHENITDRKQAEEKLRTSRLQLRALAERLQKIREEERVLVSREIHDVIGGGLTGFKMDLSWLMHNVKNAESDEEQAAFKSKMLALSGFVDQLIKETRRISSGLRPPFIDDLGLISAIDWELSEFTSRTGILHELTPQFEYVSIQKDKAVGVFRIFQETLTNVIRHSGATKVVVVLREEDERSLFGDENLVIEIRDNGRGITEEEILDSKSLGLLGMKERAMAFGGELSIRGEPGGGTTVVLKIPRKQGETS